MGVAPQLTLSVFLNKTARDATHPQWVRRLHLHLSGPQKGNVTYEELTRKDRNVDFFRINPAFEGLEHCVYYANEWHHDGASYASMAVMRHDICTGTVTYWSRPDTYAGEPFFIGSGAANASEGDGALVFLALDGRKG